MTRVAMALVNASIRRPGVTMAIAAAVTVAAVFAALQIKTKPTIESLIDDKRPASIAMRSVLKNFSSFDELVVFTELTDSNDDATKLTDFARRLSVELESNESVSAVSFQRPGAAGREFVEKVVIPAGVYYLDDGSFDAMIKRLSPEDMAKQFEQNEALIATPGPAGQQLAKQLLKDPLRLREFIADAVGNQGPGQNNAEDEWFSNDGRALLISIRGTQPVNNIEYAHQLIAEVRAAVARVNADKLHVAYTGGYAIAAASQKSIRGDMIISVIAAVVFLHVIFVVMYRSLIIFFQVIVPVAIGIAVGFGLYGLCRGELTALTAVTGGILAGLGVDYAIHFLSHVQGEMSDQLPNTLAAAAAKTLPPSFAACVTTAIGFVTVTYTGVDALRNFALLAMLGLGAILVSTWTVLPAWIVLLDRVRPLRNRALPFSFTGIGRQGKGAIVFCLVTLAGSSLAVAAFSSDWFDDDLTSMHPSENEPLELQHRIAKRFGTATEPLIVHMAANSGNELLALAHDVDAKVGSLKKIAQANSIGSLLPDPGTVTKRKDQLKGIDVERIVSDFDAAVDESSFNAAAFADYRGFLERLMKPDSVPTVDLIDDGNPMSALIAQNESVALVRPAAPLFSAAERGELIEQIRAALKDTPGATLTGISVIGYDAKSHFVEDLGELALIAGCLIFVWLLIVFRQPGHVLLSLLPVVFGIVCLMGYMVATGLRWNMVNLIALPLLIGVGVDDGVFLVSLYRREKQSLGQSMAVCAFAIVMTTATTALCFGTLVFTGTPAIRSLGHVLAVGTVLCLVGALFLLAPILIHLSIRGEAS